MLEVGQEAPEFTLPATGGHTISLRDYRGQSVVLYFYPKDSTSGCTKEANDFRELHDQFLEAGAVVLGVSKDSISSHEKFTLNQNLPFPLLSDPEAELCLLYDVYKEKSMYGRKYMGIERSTFLIDKEGKIAKVYPKVKVPNHVKTVLEDVKSLTHA
nr:thioredoxin-dependent thiol peroxidase [Bacilli bacterium]